MKNKYVFVFVMLLCISLAGVGVIAISAGSSESGHGEFRIVTSFYPVYVAVENIAGGIEGVELSNMTEPKTGCLHDYQPSTKDMVLLNEADVFVINGGGMETFMEDVASRVPGLGIVTASDNMELLENRSGSHEGHETEHDHGDKNAHVWMSLARYETFVDNIASGLAGADPVHALAYLDNAADYKRSVAELSGETDGVREFVKGRRAVLFQESFMYLAEDLGLPVREVLDLDGEAAVSAGDISHIIDLIGSDGEDTLLLCEERYSRSIAETISQATGAPVCVLDTLTEGDYAVDSYLTSYRSNLKKITEAVK